MTQKAPTADSNSTLSPGDVSKAQDEAAPQKVSSANMGTSFGAFSMSTIQPQVNQSNFSNFSMSMTKDQNEIKVPTAF